MIILPKNIKFELDYFEFGYLFTSIKEDAWDRMPRRLWLLFKITSLEAYRKHPAFGKRDREKLDKWREELQKLEKGGQDGTKSK
jgi:hypothetical protein